MLQKILDMVSNELNQKETDSQEFITQSQKCQVLYEELSSALVKDLSIFKLKALFIF